MNTVHIITVSPDYLRGHCLEFLIDNVQRVQLEAKNITQVQDGGHDVTVVRGLARVEELDHGATLGHAHPRQHEGAGGVAARAVEAAGGGQQRGQEGGGAGQEGGVASHPPVTADQHEVSLDIRGQPASGWRPQQHLKIHHPRLILCLVTSKLEEGHQA